MDCKMKLAQIDVNLDEVGCALDEGRIAKADKALVKYWLESIIENAEGILREINWKE